LHHQDLLFPYKKLIDKLFKELLKIKERSLFIVHTWRRRISVKAKDVFIFMKNVDLLKWK